RWLKLLAHRALVRESKRTYRTALRTFKLRSTTQSLPSPIVKAMHCLGRPLVARVLKARVNRRRLLHRSLPKRQVAPLWNTVSKTWKYASRAQALAVIRRFARSMHWVLKLPALQTLRRFRTTVAVHPSVVVFKGKLSGSLYWT